MYKYFKRREALFDKLVDVAVIIFAAISIIAVGTIEITSDIQLIPTITNGVTSCASIVIAATGVILTFAHTSNLIDRKSKAMVHRIYYTVCFIMLSIAFIFLTYVAMMSGDYVKGLKTGMGGLVVALANFGDFTFLVIRKYVEPHLT